VYNPAVSLRDVISMVIYCGVVVVYPFVLIFVTHDSWVHNLLGSK